MKTLIFSIAMMIAIGAQAKVTMRCDGRAQRPHPQHPGEIAFENISLVLGDGNYFPLVIERYHDRWSLGSGGQPPVISMREGEYLLLGGDLPIPANATIRSLIGRNIELIATGSTPIYPNYGVIPLPNHRRFRVGSFRLLSPKIAVMQTQDGKEIAMNCVMRESLN